MRTAMSGRYLLESLGRGWRGFDGFEELLAGLLEPLSEQQPFAGGKAFELRSFGQVAQAFHFDKDISDQLSHVPVSGVELGCKDSQIADFLGQPLEIMRIDLFGELAVCLPCFDLVFEPDDHFVFRLDCRELCLKYGQGQDHAQK